MSKFTLTLLDTAGIQNYIFASNRLQENIGASELVYRATTLWAFEALEDIVGNAHNIENPDSLQWDYKKNAAIEAETALMAEVIQAAGGNTLIMFRDDSNAPKEQRFSRQFVQKLTLRLLKDAPGLTVLAWHKDDFDFSAHRLPAARKKLEADMREHKQTRLVSSPTLGLGVTAMCESTGLAAVRTPVGRQLLGNENFPLLVPGQDKKEDEQSRLISRETTFKLAARDLANRRLRHVLGTVGQWYDFPSDIDYLGRIEGEESYVAVVHADGNNMGKHVGDVVGRLNPAEPPEIYNRNYILSMRQFSQNLEKASRAALVEIVEAIVRDTDEEKLLVAGKIPVVLVKNYRYLPFRPLVFGGDDVTFLCNGQLGVELATRYLDAFHRHTEANDLSGFYASAGISIVKMHYPFSRAYKLSEELAGSAKSLTRKDDCSALDWHFAQSGLSGSLKVIREREYVSEEGKSLCLRPLTLETGKNSWANVAGVIAGFRKNWGDKHNKVIGLREPLRKKPGFVHKYLQDFDLLKEKLPDIPGVDARETGWENGVCYYFDAIELLDHHVSLEVEK